jgi:hypothetical protein
MTDPKTSTEFDIWLTRELQRTEDIPPPPKWLLNRILLLPETGDILSGSRSKRLIWALLCVGAIAFVAGSPRVPFGRTAIIAPVEAAVIRVRTAVIEREFLDSRGQVISRTKSTYDSRKWYIEEEHRTILVTPNLLWEIDRDQRIVREHRRASAQATYSDHFDFPELRRALAQNVPNIKEGRAVSAPGLREMVVESDAQNRLVLLVDQHSMPVEWTAEVFDGKDWRQTSRAVARYNLAIDAALFLPVLPAGFRMGMSLDEQDAVANRLRDRTQTQHLGRFRVVLHDVFVNRNRDVFALVSLEQELLRRSYTDFLTGPEAGQYVQVNASATLETGDHSTGPEPLHFEGRRTIVLWWAPLPGQRESAANDLSLEFNLMPGSEPEDLSASELDIEFKLAAVPSEELLPDWMELATSPLSKGQYQLERGIALGNRLATNAPEQAIAQFDSALFARLPERTPQRALAWEGKAKVLRALRRTKEAIYCARRAFREADTDVGFQQRLREQFPEL